MERVIECYGCGLNMTVEGPQFHVMSKIRILRDKHDSINVARP